MTTPLQFLLDTNIVSETRKRRADHRVVSFLSATDPSALFISVLTLGELRKGVALKKRSDPAAAGKIASWVDSLETDFADHILGVDAAIARLWGELSAERPRPIIDTLLAATAVAHELIFVTRNAADVRGIRLKILDPWSE